MLESELRLQAVIGQGGTGRVYRASRVSDERPVAVKVLHPQLAADRRVVERFRREARAAQALSHPGCVRVLGLGEAERVGLYIAMELVEGEDLQTIIDHDLPLSPRQIERWMVQLLEALSVAHETGLVHRDLKPENLLVTERQSPAEQLKVCDFGLAKIVEGPGAGITQEGHVCGTPQYMAPEQARGAALDPRTDLYAAGVVLYQLLCGRVPFSHPVALRVLEDHVRKEPPAPSAVRPQWGIPAELEQVALRALRKDPAERYPDAQTMAEALRDASAALGDRASERLGHGSFAPSGEAGAAPRRSGPPRGGAAAPAEAAPEPVWPWLLALTFACAVFAFGVWLWL